MPFFIARETPMKRTVTVDHTVFATRAAAEEAARARYPGGRQTQDGERERGQEPEPGEQRERIPSAAYRAR